MVKLLQPSNIRQLYQMFESISNTEVMIEWTMSSLYNQLGSQPVDDRDYLYAIYSHLTSKNLSKQNLKKKKNLFAIYIRFTSEKLHNLNLSKT